eukprot:155133-Amphidinium_carterae.1
MHVGGARRRNPPKGTHRNPLKGTRAALAEHSQSPAKVIGTVQRVLSSSLESTMHVDGARRRSPLKGTRRDPLKGTRAALAEHSQPPAKVIGIAQLAETCSLRETLTAGSVANQRAAAQSHLLAAVIRR